METTDVALMALAGVVVLAAIGVAVIVSILRADRDSLRADCDELAAEHRAAVYEREQRERHDRAAVARVSPRPVSTTERDPTRELIRYRCPRCNAPAARDAAGMLRCLNGCRTDNMRGHRWSE